MRRTAGKVAFLLAAMYVPLLVGAVYTMFDGRPLPPWKYVGLLLPIVLFGPAVVAGVRLHQTTDLEQTRQLWQKSLIYAVLAMGLAVTTILMH
jgi:hypothetical protein